MDKLNDRFSGKGVALAVKSVDQIICGKKKLGNFSKNRNSTKKYL